ncbi:hypothetical protein [Legionella septentrionalis]|uniref:hypothetical protein n=1 Tax=Legionella septentrionalis TaxID=2498109 RepID=UPI000F8F32B9|nr:hypothetical protein [Legionella septentrionalis]RUQ99787.1 hypothetical protein ELY11_04195 [Legionella septentrionalis]RUR11019.1 hypothetical protein ELY14_02830 [Legionella septentrionalis]
MQVLIWIGNQLKNLIDWFSPINKEYPANETGELIKRKLESKSWFDALTSWWIQRHLLLKLSTFTGISVVAGVAGLLIGVPVLLSLAALCFSILIHSLFVFHERARHAAAEIIATEQKALDEDLKINVDFFETAAAKLNTGIEKLRARHYDLEKHSKLMDAGAQSLEQNNGKLSAVAHEMEREATRLIEPQKEIKKEFDALTTNVKEHEDAIVASTLKVRAIDTAAAEFSTAVHSFEQNQKIFSEATSRFCHFVAGQTLAKKIDPNNQEDKESIARHQFIASMNQKMNHYERLIQGFSRTPSCGM